MLIPRPRMTRPVGFCMFWWVDGRAHPRLIKICQVPVLSLPSSLVTVSTVSTYQHPHKAQIDGQLLCKLSHIKTQSVVFTFQQTIAYHVCDIMADLNIIISHTRIPPSSQCHLKEINNVIGLLWVYCLFGFLIISRLEDSGISRPDN